MRKEYDFSKGVRGKYAKKYKAGTNIEIIRDSHEWHEDKR